MRRVLSIAVIVLSLLTQYSVVNAEVEHVPSVEVTQEGVPDIRLSSDTYSDTLRVMGSLKWLILFIVLGWVILGYREPNPMELSTVLHTNRKDKQLMREVVKSGKRIPVSPKAAETIALMYGLVGNKHYILLSGVMDLLTDGTYKAEETSQGVYLRRVVDVSQSEGITQSSQQLSEILGECIHIQDIVKVCVEEYALTSKFIDTYIKESMSYLSKQAKFLWRWRIHGVDVYYTDIGSRQMLKDIKSFISYIDNYGIEGLESSTMGDTLINFGRLVVFLGLNDLNFECVVNKKFREVLSIGFMLRDDIKSQDW